MLALKGPALIRQARKAEANWALEAQQRHIRSLEKQLSSISRQAEAILPGSTGGGLLEAVRLLQATRAGEPVWQAGRVPQAQVADYTALLDAELAMRKTWLAGLKAASKAETSDRTFADTLAEASGQATEPGKPGAHDSTYTPGTTAGGSGRRAV